jgi:pre-mRNA-splicing factor 38A
VSPYEGTNLEIAADPAATRVTHTTQLYILHVDNYIVRWFGHFSLEKKMDDFNPINRTVDHAKLIHGQNPQFLVEKIMRSRIYESGYWKEHCFALTAETLIDKAVQLRCIGGQYANTRPSEFLCLALKLLQLQPPRDILLEYVSQEDFKYLRALGAFYLRLTLPAVEVYQHLEPLLTDYRKLRRRTNYGYDLVCMDEFVDSLLHGERVCDIILPRLVKRTALEDVGDLDPRVSVLDDEFRAQMAVEGEAG